MAQIRNFTSTNDSYFVLDGVSYPKVYEAMLDSGYTKDRVKLVGTNRDSSPLVFSTHYSNIRVDGASFASANAAISRLNQVVFSKGGGSGGGGTSVHNELTGIQGGQPGQYYHLTQEEYENLGGIQSIQEGDNISIDNTDPLNPIINATGGGTTGDYIPTLSEVLAEGNIADRNFQIRQDIADDYYWNTNIDSYGISSTGSAQNQKAFFNYNGLEILSPSPNYGRMEIIGRGITGNRGSDDNYISIFSSDSSTIFKGLRGEEYYGAGYDDNTYVQKKYVDDFYKSILGYNAGATQTLKNISGVLTWVTD